MADSPLKRSVKFVASDQDGMPVKRRQVQQACEQCRKRKVSLCLAISEDYVPFSYLYGGWYKGDTPERV